MKRIIAIILSCVLVLSGCGQVDSNNVEKSFENIITHQNADDIQTESSETNLLEFIEIEDDEIEFADLSDPDLLQYVEDNVYSDLTSRLNGEEYIIEDISTVYISKEYLEEIEYNSQKNIYFGYTLEELDAQFGGTRYVFTLADDGTTTVQPFEEYDDTFDQVIKNVAIGTGVILVCVTVSVVTGGVGAAPVSMIFAASAKTATTFALSSSVISAVTTGVVTQFQTGDFDEALKAAALSGSEGFKWGAISGAIVGGTSEALTLYKAAKAIPTPRDSELRALNQYGGSEQVSFLNGKEVPMSTQYATRPDVVRYNNGVLEAIEVKNYNLASKSSRSCLYQELQRQVTDRVANLPQSSTQRIVLDVKGRGLSDDLIQSVINNIRVKLDGIYPNIPIDVLY